MYYDDRLATVLRQRADGDAARRSQYRQLLDLLGRKGDQLPYEQRDCAYRRLDSLAKIIPPQDRAQIGMAEETRLSNSRLVAILAGAEPAVAEAALRKAELDDAQWQALIPSLPVQCHSFIRDRNDLPPAAASLMARLRLGERALPPAATKVPPAASKELPAATKEPLEGTTAPTAPIGTDLPVKDAIEAPTLQPEQEPATIGALVKRIEAYRQARPSPVSDPYGDSPRLPMNDDLGLRRPRQVQAFDFTADAAGRIIWASPGIAPMIIGRLLGDDAHVQRLLVRHLPIRAGHNTLAGAKPIAGDWQIDAAPHFDPLTGRLMGYRGRFRRPGTMPIAAAPQGDGHQDRMRQMLHELHTPVNAIQGFAEVIQQQLFGPTPHEYRAMAAAIAGDAATVLAGFAELDRLVRLDSGAMTVTGGTCDLTEVVNATLAVLEPQHAMRGAGFVVQAGSGPYPLTIAQDEAERLIWRLLATLGSRAAAGEKLSLQLGQTDTAITMAIELPKALSASASPEALFAIRTVVAEAGGGIGAFGAGFSLRLAASELRSAGGAMQIIEGKLVVTLPQPSIAPDL